MTSITNDINRWMYKRFESYESNWTVQNGPVSYHVIGCWWERIARVFKHELTGLLMEKYGQDTTRGANVH